MTENVIHLPRVPQWTFAERLRKVRRDTGLTQPEFAAQLDGVKPSTLEAWETGRNRPRDLPKVAADLERVTGVPRAWFLGWLDGSPDGGSGIDERARRYSKPQPSDPKVLPLRSAA